MGTRVGDLDVRIRADTAAYERSLARVVAQTRAASRQMGQVGRQLAYGFSLPLAAAGAASVKFAVDYEKSMNRVAALTGATTTQFERLKAAARESGRTTVFTATDTAKAMEFLAQTGFKVNEILGAMPGTLDLAAAGYIELGEAADIASNVLKQFSLDVSDMRRVSDVLAKTQASTNTNTVQLAEAMKIAGPLASALGIRVEELSVLIGALGDAGIQGSFAGTALARSFLDLVSTTPKAEKALTSFGIALEDATTGGLLPILDVLDEIQNKIGPNASVLDQIFEQRSIRAILPLLSRGTQALRELLKEIDTAGGSSRKIAETQFQGIVKAMELIRNAIREVSIELADSGLGRLFIVLGDKARDLAVAFAEADKATKEQIVQYGILALIIPPLIVLFSALTWAIFGLVGLFTGGAITTGLIATLLIAGGTAATAQSIMEKLRSTIQDTTLEYQKLSEAQKGAGGGNWRFLSSANSARLFSDSKLGIPPEESSWAQAVQREQGRLRQQENVVTKIFDARDREVARRNAQAAGLDLTSGAASALSRAVPQPELLSREVMKRTRDLTLLIAELGDPAKPKSIGALGEALQLNALKARVFGKEFDLIDANIEAVTASLNRLLEGGVLPEEFEEVGRAVAFLNEQLGQKKLQENAEEAEKLFKDWRQAVQDLQIEGQLIGIEDPIEQQIQRNLQQLIQPLVDAMKEGKINADEYSVALNASADAIVTYGKSLREADVVARTKAFDESLEELRQRAANLDIADPISRQIDSIRTTLTEAAKDIKDGDLAKRLEEIDEVLKDIEIGLRNDEVRKEAERAAKENARIIKQPFIQAVRNVQSAWANAFKDILKNGVSSFKELGDIILDIMINLTAEISAALVFEPVLKQLSAGGFSIGNLLGSFASLFGASGTGGQLTGNQQLSIINLLGGGQFAGNALELIQGVSSLVSSPAAGIGGLALAAFGLSHGISSGFTGTDILASGLGTYLGLTGIGSLLGYAGGQLLTAGVGTSGALGGLAVRGGLGLANAGSAIGGAASIVGSLVGVGTSIATLARGWDNIGNVDRGVAVGTLAGAAGGAALGVAYGSLVFPGLGTLIGAVLGLVVGLLVDVFSAGPGHFGANFRTFAADAQIDQAAGQIAESAFGIIQQTFEHRGPGGRALIDNIAKFDDAVANILTERQTELVAAAIQAQGELRYDFNQFSGAGDFAHILANRLDPGLRALLSDSPLDITTDSGEIIRRFVHQGGGGPGDLFNRIKDFVNGLDELEVAFRQISGEEITEAEQALRQQRKAYQDVLPAALAYGVSIESLNDAFEKGNEVIRRRVELDSITGLAQIVDPLASSFFAFTDEAGRRLREVIAAGTDFDIADALNLEKLRQILISFNQPITDLLNSLKTNTTIFSRREVLDRLQTQFDQFAVSGGDPARIANLGSQLLSLGQDAYGSTARFFELYDSVSAKLESVLIEVPDATEQTNDLLAELLDEISTNNVRDSEDRLTALDKLSEIVSELREIRQTTPGAFGPLTV